MSLSLNFPTINPSLMIDFVNRSSLDSRVTFTRASSATYFDSSGVITTAAANVPRFDHNPSTLQPQGLLIEEQRTNLLAYSEQFQQAGTWGVVGGGASIVADAGVSPSGTTAADKLNETAVTNSFYVFTGSSYVAGSAYTLSLFAKKAERDFVRLRLPSGAFTSNTEAWFNLNTGTVGTTSNSPTTSIVDVGNGWYRCSITKTATISASANLIISVSQTDGVVSYAGSANNGIYIWGAQLEAGAFATSYIPTTTTALTRNADVASMTGTNFSSWYNQTEGSLFGQFSLISSSYTAGVALDVGAGGAFGTTEYLAWTGTSWELAPGVAPINVSSSVTTTASAKVIAGIKANDSVISANGLLGTVDTSCAVPASATTLTIGRRGWSGSGNYINGWIARIAYYPTRLSNAQLQALTL